MTLPHVGQELKGGEKVIKIMCLPSMKSKRKKDEDLTLTPNAPHSCLASWKKLFSHDKLKTHAVQHLSPEGKRKALSVELLFL